MRKIKIIFLPMAVVMALIVGWLIGARSMNRGPMGQVASEQSGLMIGQIQALAELVTERVNVSDVIETHLTGRTGSIRAVVVVKGNVLISTDLTRAHFESVDPSAHRAVLVLPEPRVCQATVDHERTRVFAIYESGLWEITPGDNATSAAVVDLAYRDAQRFVADAAKDESLVMRARQHAQQVLGEFLRGQRWELSVKWNG